MTAKFGIFSGATKSVSLAPTSVTASNTPSGRAFNNGLATISFTAPSFNGKSPITSYVVTSSPGSFTSTPSLLLSHTVAGLQSSVSYTFTVTAVNAIGSSLSSSASSSITASTVPATPSAPTAVAGVDNDTVSWTAPANGGSAITGYIWASSDGKTNAVGGTPGGGPTASTSVQVTQEANTSQTYTVFAINANGNSAISSPSTSVTTQSPSFFSPPDFVGPDFVGPDFVGPDFVATFAPPSFSTYKGSLGGQTLVRTAKGLVRAQDLEIGDQLLSVDIPGIPQNFTTLGTTPEELQAMSWDPNVLIESTPVLTTINDININEKTGAVAINEDLFTRAHYIFVQRDSLAIIIMAKDVVETDLVYNYTTAEFEEIFDLQFLDITYFAYSINCEPYDFFWTERMLTFDNIEWQPDQTE